ncbi:uncharacterized protein EV422DRAFT_572638 [Fimicolochytrium jonesii]|uniref:uncharacterized protein n=1 Tax=Fimicolochytrium jonesii TaxID=1396493 RepID=UPI0022FDC584|nr:uncharacterized protein EV422DRAFT_572638 [Fimicolochytrium jonesii]KAI8815567.1 hypothetical protein EV422DRAFT_572638 [Fimicolochytrium jonesii]
MTSFPAAARRLIAINIFTVKPGTQPEFMALLKQTGKANPPAGCLSIQLHASVDGTKVLNRSEWASLEAFEKRFQTDGSKEAFAKIRELVERVEQEMYWLDEADVIVL